MKITHLCLCGPVTDNFSYQDNLLPKYHKKIGYDVSVITSQFIWNDKGKIDIDSREIYYNEYGIKTIRLKLFFGKSITTKFKIYKDLNKYLEFEKPDILFIHGVQFLNLIEVVRYLKKHPKIKTFVDNHVDFSNSARNWVSKNILHKIIWKRLANYIEPFTTKFYGVLPARVDFLVNVYGIPKKKVDLLVMGADDEQIELSSKISEQSSIRKKFGIAKEDFLIVTGGKIDAFKKQTLLLMEAVSKIENKRVKLIVFGSVTADLKERVESLCIKNKIQYIGWITSQESYKYFAAADLVVFPGRHSVFWEQVAAQGIPMLCKYWEGTTHIDVGGNVKFLYTDTEKEIRDNIEDLVNNRKHYDDMKYVAMKKGIKIFSYKTIAKRSIEN
ncbi:glycosyltransferase family 4 protein [Heyndrickxia coagulans]|jgi:1,2-diacylglycerol 3-alpha-glucosyltransferase|uniref:glycosyltransferase family 4 protein n=1 Tax=Heyndrickxia TaxID=2837504 RepID=UPI0006288A0C|nr:glycosyltransferase family 4 protein [Heyndrickxia coagulans]UXC22886.1 glycosyltransferase family 4 protein [Heyndrickxia coagulans]